MTGNNSNLTSAGGERLVTLPMLNGGLNLSELEYRLKLNESPAMKNLLWREGVLCSRDGQEWVSEDDTLGVGRSLYERLYHGFLVAHIGTKLYALDPAAPSPAWAEIGSGLQQPRGAWFEYGGVLYYKNPRGYYAITARNYALTAAPVVGYTPVIVINASPANGSGDLYQPENRIQAKKTVRYNAESGVTVYHLPVKPVDAVEAVKVDGETKTEGTDYTVDLTDGTVTFTVAPPVTVPPTNNTVEITYAKENTEAGGTLMACRYAATYGGTGDLCVVMGGSAFKPNAIFWNGNNVAMDPSYFPIDNYQLAGDESDPITGFGKQQSFLVIFKKHSVGRVKQDVVTVDGRMVIDMPYVAINDKIGCDLPYTIQLIDNNLVWCNTEQGVHILKDSSYAYENNVACISKKVNGGPTKAGLLASMRSSNGLASFDDTKRYWLCGGDGIVWVWDYDTTGYKNPSWYYLTNIRATAFAGDFDSMWHLDAEGRLTHFTRNYSDYGGAIDKSYRFASQDFGGYDRLKNVSSVILVLRPDTDSQSTLTYITDYETRVDPTPLVRLVWRLSPRNLTYRSLVGLAYTAIYRRRPTCRRVRRFTMRLDNNRVHEDLAIVSAQIFYNFQGRLR